MACSSGKEIERVREGERERDGEKDRGMKGEREIERERNKMEEISSMCGCVVVGVGGSTQSFCLRHDVQRVLVSISLPPQIGRASCRERV